MVAHAYNSSRTGRKSRNSKLALVVCKFEACLVYRKPCLREKKNLFHVFIYEKIKKAYDKLKHSVREETDHYATTFTT